MSNHAEPDEPTIDAALELWDEIRDEQGPEAAVAHLRSLPDALRSPLEIRIARIVAAEQALRSPGPEPCDPDADECAATGRPGEET